MATKMSDLLSTAFPNLTLTTPTSVPKSVTSEDSDLITSLLRLSSNSPKLVRSSLYPYPHDPSVQIRSWKMNEFKYYDIPSPFPTLARGLFSVELQGEGKEKKHRIVIRGYDKFFNIGEVPWTEWSALEHNTAPPYTLTLKSNGCIIFIAALTPTKLLVTSKHSLGPVPGVEESHAQVGERWLKTHLESVGRTEAQLAQVLWEKNWTAIAELCDDSFEEHVLPYSKDKTGLHLHGLNSSTKHFRTELTDVVDSFAQEWGFILTKSFVLQTVSEVREFTEEISKTGKWNGEALEGFVVRTHVSLTNLPTRVGRRNSRGGEEASANSPYEPGSSFFFKVKFDEPYMMYRDWREVTKVLLSGKPLVQKTRLRRPETKVYVEWVKNEIRRDRHQFDGFTKGKGIIATRDRFLKWLGSDQGKKEVVDVEEVVRNEREEGKRKFGKTIIVPVAIPGMGKTSIAVALQYLFGFGHTQSDDVKAKKPAPIFIQNVAKLLKTHDVVIADKNNHLRQHRQQLRDATIVFNPPVRLMALNWALDLPHHTIQHICSERITTRGSNHQTLRADDTSSANHEKVLSMFLRTTEDLKENEVDVVIPMDLEEGLEEALKRAVDACVEVLGVERPSLEEMGKALGVARSYEPKKGKGEAEKQQKGKGVGEVEAKNEKKQKEPRYYAILPEMNMDRWLTKVIDLNGNKDGGPGEGGNVVPESGKSFYARLLKDNRNWDRNPHITIAHVKDKEGPKEILWDRCRSLAQIPDPPLFKYKLGHLVWDDRVMAITVTDVSVDDSGAGGGAGIGSASSQGKALGAEFVDTLPEEVREHLHLTVGTAKADIEPYEARLLVGRWKKGEKTGVGEFELEDVWVRGRVHGMMR